MAENSKPAVFLALCSGNRAPVESELESDFHAALQSLSFNMKQTGFGITGFRDVLIGQCFYYLSPRDCELCYAQSAIQLRLCFPASDSRVYLDGCFLRYVWGLWAYTEYVDAISNAVDDSDTTKCSNVSSGAVNSAVFRKSVLGLVTNLTLGLEMDTRYYRTGSVVVERGMTIYGMAQCWRSLDRSVCANCLANASDSVVQCSPALEGKAMYAACFIRYSTLPFYTASTTLPFYTASTSNKGLKVRPRLFPILGLILVVLAILSILLIRRKATNETSEGLEGSEEVMRSIAELNLTFRYEVLRNATNNFSEINKLGRGGYGSVYKGVLPDGEEIAVKRMLFNTIRRVDQFFNEVILINQVRHKNLVKLLGCSIVGPDCLLVYEYFRNTSLEKFLFDTVKNNELDWGKRFDIIVGSAEGLSYLHTSSEIRIIHRDIKPSNILLDDKFKPKIADFGLAINFGEDKSHLSTGVAGTLGYMAPEYIIHGQLTEKVDVYSYGIMIIEIMTGRKNQSLVSTSTGFQTLMSMVWQHYISKTLTELLDPPLQGQCSNEEAIKVFHVGILCTQTSPILRPPMWKVVEMLNGRSEVLLPTNPPFNSMRNTLMDTNDPETSRLISFSPQDLVSQNQMSLSNMQGR